MFESFRSDGAAVVVGASGGIGGALVRALTASGHFPDVVALSRNGQMRLDLTDEDTIRAAAAHLKNLAPRLVIIATGVLHRPDMQPEKTLQALSADSMARAFAVNTLGPALVMKHLLPLLPKQGKAVLAVLSAKVGSISDNRLGGWYSYRASKAALNQIVRSASVELRRTHPDAVCVALHPGTVATDLSAPFAKSGLQVQTPDDAATALLACLDRVKASQSGAFLDRTGEMIPW